MSRVPKKPLLPPPADPLSDAPPDQDEARRANGAGRQRALVLQPRPPGPGRIDRTEEGRLAEAVGLSQAIDLEVIDAQLVPLRRISPATLLGTGRLKDLAEQVKESAIDLVIVDAPLSPVQQRNLER